MDKMKNLSEPLHQPRYDERAAWRHSASLLWRSTRPRNVIECLLLVVVLLLLLMSKGLNVALPLVMRHVVNSLSGIDDDGGFELPAAALVGPHAVRAVARGRRRQWGQQRAPRTARRT